ncbi:IS110 family RNA-guided transposase [Hymenobacter weizhouensis]|uniref:IS110 family transposase n=1 Tax=Hymenobacter sp. YIM 151500-1 TaxID=2987689 RepID=UPI002227A16A|nr:IS110 family transposase [Hymenobacter sp. YIM 151500-1]UYZ64862.1 IS110 family transposase [Hymenobacter sp. YIM 151500-1]
MASPAAAAPLKYVVGIDIAKDTFVACFGRIEASQQLRFGKEATFDNTLAGFTALLAWTGQQRTAAAPLWFVVEATGVYYEELAYFLADNTQALSVLLPNKVKHFAHSTEQKSKTDQLDARLLCRLGLERVLPAWQPPTPALRQLRVLARERQSLTQQAAKLKLQRHAYQHSYRPDARTLARLADHLQLLARQVRAVDQDLKALLETEPDLARRLAHVTSIPGMGLTSAILVVAETNGFALIENERQLASYAGLDVVQHQSGLAARAARISRRGNVRLRTALYLPALSSLRCNPQQKAFYTQLRARQPNGKPGVIAVMRKLLLLCYSLWTNDRPYDPQYRLAPPAEKEVAPATEAVEATQDEPQKVLLQDTQR